MDLRLRRLCPGVQKIKVTALLGLGYVRRIQSAETSPIATLRRLPL